MGLLHNSVGIGYNFYYLFLFLLVLFIFEISPRNKLQHPTDTPSPHSGRKSTMSTASFLTFATLLILMTLSWSQPGEAALRTSDHGDPERAAGPFTGRQNSDAAACAKKWAYSRRQRGCRKCKKRCFRQLQNKHGKGCDSNPQCKSGLTKCKNKC